MRFFKSEVRRVDRVHHSRGCQRKSLKEKPELLPRPPPVVRPPAEPHLPYADHLIPKGRQHVVVPRDPVVGVVTLQFPLEVVVLLLDWRMAIPPAPVTHLLERPRKTPSFGRPLDYPVSVAGSPPGVREPQEVERLPLRLLLGPLGSLGPVSGISPPVSFPDVSSDRTSRTSLAVPPSPSGRPLRIRSPGRRRRHIGRRTPSPSGEVSLPLRTTHLGPHASTRC